jgi:hypothetical protein
MATKLCKDCKFYEPSPYGEAKCSRPVGVRLVDDKPKRHEFQYCFILRDCSMFNPLTYVFRMCGEQGRFFEPKPDEPARRIDDSIDEYLS